MTSGKRKGFKAWLRKHYEVLLSIRSSPHEIAIGAAIGTFIAILPTPGFNILLGMLALLVYPKASKISLFLTMAILNPLIIWPLYGASITLGNLIFGNAPVIEYQLTLLEQAFHFSRRFLVGNAIIALASALMVYVIVLITSAQSQARKRMQKGTESKKS
ncbi:MAG: DUF2062 domain-containing protein [archaeon]